MPKLYVISGCNGAGKTTASYTILPEMLDCREFVNADEIARGLSPFNPEQVAIEAGRLMLRRMNDLRDAGVDFAFETTLATRSHLRFIEDARRRGYFITLLYLWLTTPELAVERVALRVKEGGHHIPEPVVHRRYVNGLKNLNLYLPLCDYWAIYNSSAPDIRKIASGSREETLENIEPLTFEKIRNYGRS